jgi:putative transposase
MATDDGNCYVARDIREFARDIGLEPRTRRLQSLQSNGMAEAVARTFKRDYAGVTAAPDAPLC